jgi:hypothetical protein
MAQPDVVCQVDVVPGEKMSFTWSQGGGRFEKYHLTGMCLENLSDLAKQARQCLRRLVNDELRLHKCGDDKGARDQVYEQIRRHSYDLADVGYKLYQQVFLVQFPDVRWTRVTNEIQQWLTNLKPEGNQRNEKVSLELVLNGRCAVPWNILYDREPKENDFLQPESADRWEPFWGCRYYVGGGDRIMLSPPRRKALNPRLLLVLDDDVFAKLPVNVKNEYQKFADAGGHTIVDTRAKLRTALTSNPPEVIYWLSHASGSGMTLDKERIPATEWMRLIQNDDGGILFDGLAFFNACQTVASGEGHAFLDTVNKTGMRGLLGTEVETVDTFAWSFGLQFLTRLMLGNGEWIGKLLSDLRSGAGVPLGLLYFAYCSPQMCVRTAR